MAQYDAHVRARARLIQRVVDREYEWSVSTRRRKGETHEELDARLRKETAQKLAIYKWPKYDWGLKYGPYSPFSGQEVIGRYKDVPSQIIHAIMCTVIK